MNIVNGNAAVVTKQHPSTATRAPVLITEHEVVFGTAAAVPVRPDVVHWWTEVSGVVLAPMRRLSRSSTPSSRQPRRRYPKRHAFLERSCMGREMQRL